MKHDDAVALATCLLEQCAEAGFGPRPPVIRFVASSEQARAPHALPAGVLETHRDHDGRELVTRLAIVTLIVNDDADDAERERWRQRYLLAHELLVLRMQRTAEQSGDTLNHAALIDCRDEAAGLALITPAADPSWWKRYSQVDAMFAARGTRGARGYQELQSAVLAAFKAGEPLPRALQVFVEHALESGPPRRRGGRPSKAAFTAAMAECVNTLHAQGLTKVAARDATSEAAETLKAVGLFRGQSSLDADAIAKRLKPAPHK